MGQYYYVKDIDGESNPEKEVVTVDFLEKSSYNSICFLLDNVDKMNGAHRLGEALIEKWSEPVFSRFVKTRGITIGSKQYSYGTLRTIGNSLDDFELVVHVYAYADSIAKELEGVLNTDHLFVYWVDEQPALDTWMGILHARRIGGSAQIQSTTWKHLDQNVLAELERIRIVNVSDGATHPSDEKHIKEIVKKINRRSEVINAHTFSAFLIHQLHFNPADAHRITQKMFKKKSST